MKRLLTRLTIFPILSSIVLMLLFAACHDPHTSEILTRADRLMESAPDSAYSLLRSIDSTRLRRADAPLYAVLDAQAHHKLDLTPPSDSLLDIAVEHYTAHGPDSLLMKALFYRAVGYNHAGNINNASIDATSAWEVAEEIDNHYWIAKSAELVADIANSITNFQEELKWRQIAAHHYKLANKDYNHICALCDVASIHLNLHHAERALSMDDSIRIALMQCPQDTELQLYHAYTSMYIQNHYGSIDRTDTLYNFLLKNDSWIVDKPSVMLIKTNLLLHSGKYKECLSLLDTLSNLLHSPQEKSMLHEMYYQVAKKTSDLQLTWRMVDSLLKDQNIIISQALDQPLTTSQRDYFHTRAHSYKEARAKAVARGWCIFGLASTIIIGGLLMYRIKIRNNKKILDEKIQQIKTVNNELKTEIDNKKAIESELNVLKTLQQRILDELAEASQRGMENAELITSLKGKLREHEGHINRLTKRLASTTIRLKDVYVDKWRAINILCSQLKDHDNKNSSIVICNITKELEKMKTKEFYRSLENELNVCMDGVITKFRTQCELGEDEVKLSILLFAGFSPIAVSLLTDISQRTVYNKRRRIIEEIERQNPVDKTLFISCLIR